MVPPFPLILGASGRIGCALRYRLGAEAALWQARRMQRGKGWVVFDPLADLQVLQTTAAQAQQILCLAGPVPGRGGDLEDNIHLAEACVRAAASSRMRRVLLASSAAVYGAQTGALHEDLRLRPATPYGEAKAAMEARALVLGAELGVAVSCLRIGNVAGFDAILGGWRPGFRLDQFPDGKTPRRSYIGPLMLADVLIALLAVPNLPELLNIAQAPSVEMGALLRAAGRSFATVSAPKNAISEVVLDVTRLNALLAPIIPLPPADPAQMVAEISVLEPYMKETFAK